MSLFGSNGKGLSQGDIDAITQYNNQLKQGVTSQTAWNRTMLQASPAAQHMVSSANGAAVAVEGLGTEAELTRWQMLKLRAASIALNVAFSMVSMLIVQGVVKAFTHLYNIQDKLAEKTKELTDSLKSQTDEYNNLKSDLDEVNKKLKDNESRYFELIQKQKESGLTTEESGELEELQRITGELTNQKNILEENIRLKKESAASTAQELASTLLKQEDVKSFMDGAGGKIKSFFNEIQESSIKMIPGFGKLYTMIDTIVSLFNIEIPKDSWLNKIANIFDGTAVISWLTGTDIEEDSYDEAVSKYEDLQKKMKAIRDKYDKNGDGIIDSEASMSAEDSESYKKYYDESVEVANNLKTEYQELDDAIKAIEADPNLTQVNKEELERLKAARDIIEKILGYNNDSDSGDGVISDKDVENANKMTDSLTEKLKKLKDAEEKVTDILEEQELANLNYQFEQANHELEKLATNLDVLSTKLDMTFDSDHSSSIQTLGKQFIDAGKYGNSLRAELDKLLKTVPANGKEAEALASQLESLGNKFYDNQRKIIEYRKQVHQARAEMITEIAEMSTEANEQLSNIVSETFDIMENGSVTGGLFSSRVIQPFTMDAVERQRQENDDLIAEEQRYRDAIATIRKKASVMMKADEDKERQKKLADAVSDYEDAVKEVTDASGGMYTLIETQSENAMTTVVKNAEDMADAVKDSVDDINKYLSGKGLKFVGGNIDVDLKDGESSTEGHKIVEELEEWLGVPYKWGGNSKTGVDCSGLVQEVFKANGVDLSRTTYTQVNEGQAVDKTNQGKWKEGDLVFFGDPSSPHHVGIYVGGGKYVHAPRTGEDVQIADISDRKDIAAVRRVIGLYATGTKDYGIAGENYKKEFAINKKTGEWHVINSPTLFDKKEYDIVGEKVSEKIDKPIDTFADGTLTNTELLGYIKQASKATGVPVNVLAALIQQESGGRWVGKVKDGTAYSYGYTQLYENGALAQLRQEGKSDLAEKAKTDPYTNVLVGAQHLLRNYENTGNWQTALTRYNGSGSAAEKYGQTVWNRANSSDYLALSDKLDSSVTELVSIDDFLNEQFENIVTEQTNKINESLQKIEAAYKSWSNDFSIRFSDYLRNGIQSKPESFANYDKFAEEAYTSILDFSIQQSQAGQREVLSSISQIQALYNSAVEGFNSAKTADEQSYYSETMKTLQEQLSSLDDSFNNYAEQIQNALISKAKSLDGDYVNSMSYLTKNNEKLMRELEDANINERGSIREQILANFQRQIDTATERQNKNLQAIEDMYTNATETQRYMLENYKVQEVFDADGELNSNFEEIKSLMIANGDEELVNEFVNFVSLYQQYLKNSKEAGDDINNIKDNVKDFKNDYNGKVETYLEIQNALADILDTKLAKQEAKYNATSSLFDFQQTLRQEKLDAEAQLNANKHLQEWLDPETRALLYNDEDHSAYTAEIDRINGEIESKYNEYLAEISSLKPEEMYKEAEITAKWEQQLAILQEELDVAKGSYEVQKKTLELNNASKERDTQIIMGNRIVNVADPERMYNLTMEKVQLENDAALTQQKIADNKVLREMESENLSLQTDINAINQFIDEIGSMPEEMLEKWSESLPSEDTLLAYYGSVVGSPTKWMNEHVDDFMGIIAGLTITDIGDISNTLVDYQAIRNNLVDTFGEGNPIIEAIDNLLFAHKYTKSGNLVDFEQYHDDAYYSNYGSEYRDTEEELPSLSERNIQAEMDAIIANANKNGGQLLESDYAELAKLETLRNKKIYENDLDYEQTSKYGGQIFGSEKSSPNIELVDGSGILIDGTLYVAQGDVEIIHKKNNRDAISDMIENGTLASSMQSVSYDLMNNLATNASIVNSLLNSSNKQIPNKSYTFGDIIIENTADVNGIINEFSTKFINIVETTDNMSD